MSVSCPIRLRLSGLILLARSSTHMSTPLHIHSSRTPAFLRRRFERRVGVSASCPIRLWLVSEEQHTISISPLKFTAVACCQRSARALAIQFHHCRVLPMQRAHTGHSHSTRLGTATHARYGRRTGSHARRSFAHTCASAGRLLGRRAGSVAGASHLAPRGRLHVIPATNCNK